MARRAREQEGGGALPFDAVLAGLVVGVLALATALTLKPFFSAILWALVLAITAAPVYGAIAGAIPSRPRLAALLTSLVLVLILLLPALGLTRAIIYYTPDLIAWVDQVSADRFSAAPSSIANLPVVGGFLSENWEAISRHLNAYVAHFKADIEEWLLWGLREMESVGLFVFEIGFAVILAGVFLARRDRLSGLAVGFFDRIGGDYATHLLSRGVLATRSTVRGVVGSAIAEAIVAAFAYWLAGVPAWLFLGGLTFFAALIQIGAPLVWIPVAIWLFAQNQPEWALFIIGWGVLVVYPVENFSRPILAGKTTPLPGLLIFVGVLGGLVAWGLIGIFLGPVILAVAYELTQDWLGRDGNGAAQPATNRRATSGDPSP
jgi:predicted PurR-regulated permease PerM